MKNFLKLLTVVLVASPVAYATLHSDDKKGVQDDRETRSRSRSPVAQRATDTAEETPGSPQQAVAAILQTPTPTGEERAALVAHLSGPAQGPVPTYVARPDGTRIEPEALPAPAVRSAPPAPPRSAAAAESTTTTRTADAPRSSRAPTQEQLTPRSAQVGGLIARLLTEAATPRTRDQVAVSPVTIADVVKLFKSINAEPLRAGARDIALFTDSFNSPSVFRWVVGDIALYLAYAQDKQAPTSDSRLEVVSQNQGQNVFEGRQMSGGALRSVVLVRPVPVLEDNDAASVSSAQQVANAMTATYPYASESRQPRKETPGAPLLVSAGPAVAASDAAAVSEQPSEKSASHRSSRRSHASHSHRSSRHSSVREDASVGASLLSSATTTSSRHAAPASASHGITATTTTTTSQPVSHRSAAGSMGPVAVAASSPAPTEMQQSSRPSSGVSSRASSRGAPTPPLVETSAAARPPLLRGASSGEGSQRARAASVLTSPVSRQTVLAARHASGVQKVFHDSVDRLNLDVSETGASANTGAGELLSPGAQSGSSHPSAQTGDSVGRGSGSSSQRSAHRPAPMSASYSSAPRLPRQFAPDALADSALYAGPSTLSSSLSRSSYTDSEAFSATTSAVNSRPTSYNSASRADREARLRADLRREFAHQQPDEAEETEEEMRARIRADLLRDQEEKAALRKKILAEEEQRLKAERDQTLKDLEKKGGTVARELGRLAFQLSGR